VSNSKYVITPLPICTTQPLATKGSEVQNRNFLRTSISVQWPPTARAKYVLNNLNRRIWIKGAARGMRISSLLNNKQAHPCPFSVPFNPALVWGRWISQRRQLHDWTGDAKNESAVKISSLQAPTTEAWACRSRGLHISAAVRDSASAWWQPPRA
jgi:hypothetical protein